MLQDIEPVVLHGESVRLVPLRDVHAQGLYNRGQVKNDWIYLPRSSFVDLADTRQWIRAALNTPGHIPYALIETEKGRAVGSTRLLNIRPEHRSLEIGWSWIGQEWQRCGINTESKLLLLRYAFEFLGCLRVEFKTDLRNVRAQQALKNIGAQEEGVLRKHMIVQGDYARDSVYFSVVAPEWQDVKQQLETLCKKRRHSHGGMSALPADES